MCLLFSVVLKSTEEHKSLLYGFNAALPIGASCKPGFVPSPSNWNPTEFGSHPFAYNQTSHCPWIKAISHTTVKIIIMQFIEIETCSSDSHFPHTGTHSYLTFCLSVLNNKGISIASQMSSNACGAFSYPHTPVLGWEICRDLLTQVS